MTTFPLIYIHKTTKKENYFRKVSEKCYQRDDGRFFSLQRMQYNFDFYRDSRKREFWTTNINGFRIKVKGEAYGPL